MIGIINYGLGNLASIKNMFRRLEVDSIISSDPEELASVDRLILPGVGAFDQGMKNLAESGLIEPLNQWVVQDKKPILGICLGVQLLTEGSDEGDLSGLGWIKGRTVAFDKSRLESSQRVPNMGWRYVDNQSASELTFNLPEDPRFYFVHSYHLQLKNPEDVILTTDYGYTIEVGLQRENILGVQFHPEKSHKYGKAILKNFATLDFTPVEL
jgi:glutamine amidotransferase